jgi:hypothetical protein
MAKATLYIQVANEQTWAKIPNKSDFINKVLVQLGQEMKEAELKEKNNGGTNETTKETKSPETSQKVS